MLLYIQKKRNWRVFGLDTLVGQRTLLESQGAWCVWSFVFLASSTAGRIGCMINGAQKHRDKATKELRVQQKLGVRGKILENPKESLENPKKILGKHIETYSSGKPGPAEGPSPWF